MFKKLIALFAMCLLFAACAATPQQTKEISAKKMIEMQNFARELQNKGIVAVFSKGESADEQMAYDEADLVARANVAKAVESKIASFARKYAEDVNQDFTKHHEEVLKNVVSTTVNGVTIIKIDVDVSSGRYKVYAVAVMDPKSVLKAYEDAMAAQQADMVRVKAASGYKQLEEAIKAYEEVKAKQH